MAHPFQGVLIGQVLLGTVAGKEVPKGMQLILVGIGKAAFLTETFQVGQQFLLAHLWTIGHLKNRFRYPR